MTRSRLPTRGYFIPTRMIFNDYFYRTWEKAANHLEHLCHSYQADELRQKLHHIREDELAHQQGEGYPSQEKRIRYASWGNFVSQGLG